MVCLSLCKLFRSPCKHQNEKLFCSLYWHTFCTGKKKKGSGNINFNWFALVFVLSPCKTFAQQVCNERERVRERKFLLCLIANCFSPYLQTPAWKNNLSLRANFLHEERRGCPWTSILIDLLWFFLSLIAKLVHIVRRERTMLFLSSCKMFLFLLSNIRMNN